MNKWIAVAIVALLPWAASAQQLWQGAKYGMTPAEVVAAFPGAEQIEPRASRGTAVTKVRLSGVELAGLRFTAKFAFDADRLVTVDVQADELSDAQFHKARNSLLAALRSKYGPELARQSGDVIQEMTWAAQGGTTIKLITSFISTGFIDLLYGTSVAQDAAKL
jgi:hypothetical protein